MTLYNRFGWQSSLEVLTNSEAKIIRIRLQEFVGDASPEQVRAWDQSVPWLQSACRELTAREPVASQYTAILEYELPRDFRRPDAIVLQGGCVVVVEFKGYAHASQAAIDQALGYARDLGAYHASCSNHPVIPVLISRGAEIIPTIKDGVYIAGPKGLDSLLKRLSDKGKTAISAIQFLSENSYAPLPSIVQAARHLFLKQPLPLIKRARAATDPALQHISSIARDAAKSKSRHLVLLSGIPGSGKTLVGLQLVHAGWIDELAVDRSNGRPSTAAVYLSGNGPLVEVLQHALKEAGGGGKTFVQGIKNYVAQYSRRGAIAPPEHLIVFDEAQRAHDAERVATVHDQPVGKSEPDHLLEFCQRIPEWCVLVALIGDGQAIHIGEEGGANLWANAIQNTTSPENWTVHGAPHFLDAFKKCGVKCDWSSALNLDTEIRFHLTPKVHRFVEGLLDQINESNLVEISNELFSNSHRFLITRNLAAAKNYLRERYSDAPEARFGLLASSKDKWLLDYGVDNSFQTTKRLRVGPWYNASPSEANSCCQLETVATEFSSQGLELDCALVAWGSDLLWSEKGWSIANSRGTRGFVKDPLAMRKNVYRVLLTRGRDGTVVFVPDDPRTTQTFEHLLACGMRQLT